MARAEIKKLRGRISGTKADSLEKKKDMKTMARQIYTYEQVNKLPIAMQKKVLNLCEGANSLYKIDGIIREVKKDAKQRI